MIASQVLYRLIGTLDLFADSSLPLTILYSLNKQALSVQVVHDCPIPFFPFTPDLTGV